MQNSGGLRNKGTMWMAGCALLLLVAMAGFFGRGGTAAVPVAIGDAPGAEHSPAAAAAQWEQLLELGAGAVREDLKGTAKWQGTWRTLLSAEEAAGALASRLGLGEIRAESVQGRTVHKAAGNPQGIASGLTLTSLPGEEENAFYVVLRMESRGAEAARKMQERIALSGESLADEGVRIQWNGALQGEINPGLKEGEGVESAAKYPLGESLSILEKGSWHALNLTAVEDYEDGGTVSRSYAVPDMAISVLSGGHRVSLQMAVHRNDLTGQEEVSLGSPLLTVEY
ncbi:YwmB family TATA-box binding protein [Paenibacillus sp. A14]|uniref:YwmB family TATA-box binding protein n=1 Tax=Paenibacillus sp. A14 TaxID=3119820 RepID=UPI002FE40F9C